MGKKDKDKNGLTASHERFCQKYLLYNFNAKRAYLAAMGSSHKESTAETEGSKLLRNPQVKRRVEQLIDGQEQLYADLRHKLIEELSRIAFSDQRHLTKWGERLIRIGKGKKSVMMRKSFVSLINSDTLSDADAATVAEVSQTVNGVALKLHSKERAMDLLGKHLGMWDKPVTGNAGNVNMQVNVTSDKAAKLIAEVVEHGAERN
jgi:phage terminase small subunit